MSTIKSNIVANYIGQAYTAFIGFLILPIYLNLVGAESFGLIGFYIMLQAWMQLLDMGLSPALSRQMAMSSESKSSEKIRRLLRSLETLFGGLVVIFSIVIYFYSTDIALNWLRVNFLDRSIVASCLSIMGVVVGLRWWVGLYRSAIAGLERQVLLNVLNFVFTTFRFPASVVVIILFDADLVRYFQYQLIIAIVELLVIRRVVYSIVGPGKPVGGWFYPVELKAILPFAMGLAYTSSIWLFITQVDKFIFTGVLPLGQFGYFTLVVTASGAIALLSAPVSQALLPRMTSLIAAGELRSMLTLYFKATRFISYCVLPLTVFLAMYAVELVYVWTGDVNASLWVADVLPWYFLANGLLALVSFQYFLQFAYGKVQMHVVYNTAMLLICVPGVVYVANYYGPAAVGVFWVVMRLVTLLIWTPIVHHRLAPKSHSQWLLGNVIPGVLVALLCWLLLSNTGSVEMADKFIVLLELGWRGLLIVFITAIGFRIHSVVDHFFALNVISVQD